MGEWVSMHNDDYWKQRQQPKQEEQTQEKESTRIYLATDGLTSNRTKEAYNYAFNDFKKITLKNDDLRALLNTKQKVVESKIIDHITYLKDVRHLSYVSIQTRLSGILRFFSMDDYHLNVVKIRRFLPEDTVVVAASRKDTVVSEEGNALDIGIPSDRALLCRRDCSDSQHG